MSTIYGRPIRDREGRSVHVEAFGAVGTVKIFVADSVMEMNLDSSAEIEALIDALRLCHNHVWKKQL